MNRIIILTVIIAISSFSIVGCSSTKSTAQQSSQGDPTGYMYLMTAEQADNVLAEAMKYQFSDAPIVKVELPYKGYFVTQRFLLDAQDFTARMIPAKGLDQSGKLVDGYYFEVLDSGTMPISGSVRASNLFAKIIEISNNTAKKVQINH